MKIRNLLGGGLVRAALVHIISNTEYAFQQHDQNCPVLKNEFNKVRNFDNKVKVFRNMMDFDLPQWKHKKTNPFAEDKDVTDRIVIGWVGLTSHFQDLVRLKPIMKIIHQNFFTITY